MGIHSQRGLTLDFLSHNWWLFAIAVFLHLAYAYRNHSRWARLVVDSLGKLAARQSDEIVLAWVFTADFFFIAALLLSLR